MYSKNKKNNTEEKGKTKKKIVDLLYKCQNASTWIFKVSAFFVCELALDGKKRKKKKKGGERRITAWRHTLLL